MKAAVLTEYGKFEIKDVPKPQIKDTEILIKVSYAGICGSDMHIFKGDFHPRTPVPFIPGHEFAGTIAETGSNVTRFSINDKVSADPIIWCGECPACIRKHYPACTSLKLIGVDMDGGFSEYVAADQSMVFKIDQNIKDQHGALTELLSIGFHACRRAGVKKDDSIVIWGSGRVGSCILQAARTITDNTIFMVDVLENRLSVAAKAYSNIITINPDKDDPIKKIKNITDNKGVDIAFEAVGHAVKSGPNPVRGCIQSIRGAGTVCVLGLADDPVPVVMKELIWKEAKIIASRVTHGEFPEAIRNLKENKLKPDIIVSKILPLEEINKAFQLLEKEPGNYLKILLRI